MDISDRQAAQFQADGFLIAERVICAAQVERILAAMNRVYTGTYNRDMRPAAVRRPLTPFGTSSSVHWVLNARTVDGDLWNLSTDPELGRAAARLLQTPSVSVVEDQLLAKPDHGAPVNLHQDYSYWRFSTSTNMLTCWLALTDMTAQVGPVELVPGSHRWGIATRPRELIHGSSGEYLSVIQDIVPKGNTLEFVSAAVPKGGGVFFHGLTFHGSRANHTDSWRRAVSLHWAARDCRLNRAALVDYDHPFLFAGLRQGDRLVNKYLPEISRAD